MNILKIDKNICTGCALCAVSCSNKAISMSPDNDGFLSPEVDESLCANCGKCISICPQNTRTTNECFFEQKVYACQALDQKRLIIATAGGLFPTIADFVISKDGVVYGAAYDDNMYVVHKAAHSVEETKAFSGSKYVQSSIYTALTEIRNDLQNGTIVLFSGTPCQVDAVKKYCEDMDTTNLFTIDVICYGVPSPSLFRAYLDSVERKSNAKVIDFKFRDKHTNGWSHTTVITFLDKTGKIATKEENDYYKIPYYRMFASRNCFRRSCYSCKYNTLNRTSDITTGNFWKIEKISNAFKTTLGVSMAIINTPKGAMLFSEVKNKLIVEGHTLKEAVEANDALTVTQKLPKNRERIYRYFNKKGFDKTVNKFYTKRWYYFIRPSLGKLKATCKSYISKS